MSRHHLPLTLNRKLRFFPFLVFDQVLRSGSLSRAAKELNLTQSAVTKVIHELESHLGASLLVRSNRGVTATELGLVVAKRARVFLAELREMMGEVNARVDGSSGHVVVGTLISASADLLPRAIQLLKSRAPGVVVTLRVGQMDTLLTALAMGDVDLIVSRVPETGKLSDRLGEIEIETLYADQLRVVSGAGHPLSRQPSVALADTLDFPWILPTPDASLRLTADGLFRDAQLPIPSNIVESLSVLTNVALMLDQRHIGLMPAAAAQPFVMMGVLAILPCGELPSFGEIGCYTARGREPRAVVDAFKACLRDAVPLA
ncbi:MAG: LysR family transcriptional regulator [Pigmentiphaga sp.]